MNFQHTRIKSLTLKMVNIVDDSDENYPMNVACQQAYLLKLSLLRPPVCSQYIIVHFVKDTHATC